MWLLCLCGAGTPARDCRHSHRRPRLVPQPIPHILAVTPPTRITLFRLALAGGNGNGRPRHLQKFREEFDAGLVGPALDRRRGQRKFKRVAKFPGDRVLPRPGMNAGHGECHSAGRLLARTEIHRHSLLCSLVSPCG